MSKSPSTKRRGHNLNANPFKNSVSDEQERLKPRLLIIQLLDQQHSLKGAIIFRRKLRENLLKSFDFINFVPTGALETFLLTDKLKAPFTSQKKSWFRRSVSVIVVITCVMLLCMLLNSDFRAFEALQSIPKHSKALRFRTVGWYVWREQKSN